MRKINGRIERRESNKYLGYNRKSNINVAFAL